MRKRVGGKALLIAVQLLLAAWCMASSPQALGATYYFSTSGSDSNSGLDTAHPKQTLTAVAALMLPGNTLCLKRGDVWYVTGYWDVVSKIGTSSQPIVVQDYGSGNKPVVAHIELITSGWTQYNQTGKYYHSYRSSISDVMRCFVSGAGKQKVSTLNNLTNSNQFYADTSSDRVYLYGNPGTATVELVPQSESTYLQNCQYLTWQNIEFRGGDWTAVSVEAPTHTVAFESCDFRKASCYNLSFTPLGGNSGTTQDTHTYPHVHNCYVNKDWNVAENPTERTDMGDGILFTTAEGGTIQSNTLVDCGHGSIYLRGSSSQQYGTHNCIVELNDTSQPVENYGYSLCVTGVEGKCTANVVRRNFFHDNPVGNELDGDHNYFYSNIFARSKGSPLVPGQGAGMYPGNWTDNVCHHNTYVNNTIYDCIENSIHQCRCSSMSDDPSTNVFKNNLVVKWQSYGVRQESSSGTYPTNQTWQYNCFWQTGGSSSTPVLQRVGDASSPYTVAQADTAFTGWANNLQVNPVFVSSTPTVPADFKLSSSSPVKAAGTPITGLTGFVDYDGNAWNPTTPSIGAFQYLGSSAPVANFTGNPTSGYTPLAVAFTDTSTNTPTSWSWTFGDGGASTAQSPSHTYTSAGSYTVTLTATNAYGSDGETKTNYITASAPPSPPVANFTGNPTSGYAPLAVAFTDTSTNTPTSWSWTFGDGGTSTAQNPSHTYTSAGSYTVTLTATNAYGSDGETKTNYITASTPPSPPVAAFSGTPTSGMAPLAVTFTDSSTNSPTSWSWNFGDSSTSTSQNPSHTYSGAGNYTVSLRATNAGGYDDEVKTNYISVSANPTPTFVAAGTVASGTGTITPALPAGIASNDILLLFLETANEAVSISSQNGGTWTAVTNSPQGTGTAGGSAATRLTAYWSRYNGTQGAPTASDSGNHQLGRIVAVRGCITSGNPWDVTAGGVESTADTSGSIPGATTTVANTLVVAAIATALPDASGTANFSAWTNANLTSVAEQTDNTVTAGNGGGLGIVTGAKATAGAYGNMTVTCASSAAKGLLSIALRPTAGGGSAPVAAFSGSPTSGTAPLAVAFTDSSTNTPTSWSWNFGDSSTSTSQNPSHTYAAGTYTVSLRATNANGYDDEVKTNYITATGSFTLSASPSTVATGGQLTVSWTAPSSPHGNLWVFMVASGAPNNQFLSSPAPQNIGTTGTSGTLYFTAPSTTGTYVFRLEDASQTCVGGNCITVAESNAVTVQ